MASCRSFYAEFDDVTGPCVVSEEPAGCLTVDVEGRRIWETFSDYVITGNVMLNGLVVQVRAGRDAVLCVPTVLQDEEKYARNALLFSLGVAVPGASLPAASGACTAAVKRLAETLRAMEAESLDGAADAGDARRDRLSRVVPSVLVALRMAAVSACSGCGVDLCGEGDPVATALSGFPSSGFCDAVSSGDVARGAEDAAGASFQDGDPNVLSLRRPWLRRGAPPRTSSLHGGLLKARPPPEVAPWEVPVLLARPRDLLALSAPATPGGTRRLQGSRQARSAAQSGGYVARAGDDAWDLAVQQVLPSVGLDASSVHVHARGPSHGLKGEWGRPTSERRTNEDESFSLWASVSTSLGPQTRRL